MRLLFTAVALSAILGLLPVAAQDGKTVVVTGPHICCPSCDRSVGMILAKVDGVADVKCDRKNKTVTFTAKDRAAAQAALNALYEGGFGGTGKYGKDKLTHTAAADSTKQTEITVGGVHACCGQCTKAIEKLFPSAKVTFGERKGAQRAVTIRGENLTVTLVLDTLEQGGFSGKAVKR